MNYNEYLYKAEELIREKHGNGTTEMHLNLKSSLHTVANSLILLDLIKTMTEKEEATKATKKTASK